MIYFKKRRVVRSDAHHRKPIMQKPMLFAAPEISAIPLNQVKETFHKSTEGRIFSAPLWIYRDQEHYVSNTIFPYTQHSPHLVLTDSKRTPRFVLGYKAKQISAIKGDKITTNRTLVITAIQRVRTAYLPHDSRTAEVRWSKPLEKKRSQDLEKELGGKPGELLLAEFLFLHRAQIIAGAKVELVVSKENKQIYMPLVDRFFKVVKRLNDGTVYCELNPARERVKKILAQE